MPQLLPRRRGGTIPACAGEPAKTGPMLDWRGDYPRVRGGTRPAQLRQQEPRGLSPRARGNPWSPARPGGPRGTIPACAGEPVSSTRSSISTRDYPRVRGGTHTCCMSSPCCAGLSPRARGNHRRLAFSVALVGTIPACAGEPTGLLKVGRSPWDYPRVRGGTAQPVDQFLGFRGLSPRARGNPRRSALRCRGSGTIPACAGEPRKQGQAQLWPRDYPRVRGGTSKALSASSRTWGLSPRARGNPSQPCACLPGQGTIPACAGEPMSFRRRCRPAGDYPRVRGGTALTKALNSRPLGLSPRARGNPGFRRLPSELERTIPACAGEPDRWRQVFHRGRDYPRVRGGTIAGLPSFVKAKGLSPRARGNLLLELLEPGG